MCESDDTAWRWENCYVGARSLGVAQSAHVRSSPCIITLRVICLLRSGLIKYKKFKRAHATIIGAIFLCYSRMLRTYHDFITLTPMNGREWVVHLPWPVSRSEVWFRAYQQHSSPVALPHRSWSILCNRALVICIIILMVFRVPVSNNFLSAALYVYIMRA